MKNEDRIVMKIPVTEIWNDGGTISKVRVRNLGQGTITELLRSGPVQFVVADCGFKLEWIPMDVRFDFWKRIRPHLAEPAEAISLKQFPLNTAYAASEWRIPSGAYLVLLEKHH
jgi:hypothetical protein